MADYRLESFDEYDDPCEMNSAYCNQVSNEEFEEQSATATEQALMDLMAHLDKNPNVIQTLLHKRKKEDVDNMGLLSYLKMKMFSMVNGKSDSRLQVSQEECQEKVTELKSEMSKVFEYSLKAKGRRCSSRLAAKKQKLNGVINDENNPELLRVPHPPAPPPPPPLISVTTPGKAVVTPKRPKTPLKDVNFQMNTPQSLRVSKTVKLSNRDSGGSFTSFSTIGSFSSLQAELLSSNPLKRLRATNKSRSPGGTPQKGRQTPGSSPGPKNLMSEEPLYRAFVNSMQQKFRNVRSPSPAADTLYDNFTSPRSEALNTSGFTP